MTFDEPDDPLEALTEASFVVMPQEFVCIIGPSGCGKSTLLRILGGVVQPSAGRVLLGGQPLQEPQHQVGFVFQHANLMPWRTTLQNVMLPLEIEGWAKAGAAQRGLELLQLVGLESFASNYPRDLSGGMRQRVALARALATDPDVLLLDEPFGALDALTRERMNCELLRIWQVQRKTVIMVTHNIQEAIFLSDRVLTMTSRPGRIELEVPIDLPRPRTMDMLYTPHFQDLTRALRQSLSRGYDEIAPATGRGQ